MGSATQATRCVPSEWKICPPDCNKFENFDYPQCNPYKFDRSKQGAPQTQVTSKAFADRTVYYFFG